MLPEYFVIFGAMLNLFGASTYIKDTLKGKTKPNRVSWFLWALVPLIAFFIQRNEGVGWANLLTFMVGFVPLIILIASFVNKQSYWAITKFDIICGLFSLAGILFYLLASNAVVAVMLLILADGLAALPTLQKSLKYPETESYTTFLCGVGNSTITLLSLHTFSFLFLGFPVYILIMDILLFLFIYPKTNHWIRKNIFKTI